MMRSILRVFSNLKGNEKGSVLVLAAAMMVAILGSTALVVDLGTLTLEKIRLQNACDAAALAAARELPSRAWAEFRAFQYLAKNHVHPWESDVDFDEDLTEVTVKASRTKDYYFARVLGHNKGKVHAGSTAIFGSVCAATGVVPFGIPDQPLVYGVEYQLKAGSHDDYGSGNYGALAFEFKGASSYENNLKYGYNGKIRVGDWVTTEPGNMSGPTKRGVNYRLNQCPHTPQCTIEHYEKSCPRVMIVPIFDPGTIQGRDEVQIVGFGVFLLKGVEGSGNESNVTGYFLRMVPPNGIDYELDPHQTDYGLHAAKLLK
jgi:hypothetical protein